MTTRGARPAKRRYATPGALAREQIKDVQPGTEHPHRLAVSGNDRGARLSGEVHSSDSHSCTSQKDMNRGVWLGMRTSAPTRAAPFDGRIGLGSE
jgi:hypothetical protein